MPLEQPPMKTPMGGVCLGKERRPWGRIDRVEFLGFLWRSWYTWLGRRVSGPPRWGCYPQYPYLATGDQGRFGENSDKSTLKWRKLSFFSFIKPIQGSTMSVTRATISVKLTCPLAAFRQPTPFLMLLSWNCSLKPVTDVRACYEKSQKSMLEEDYQTLIGGFIFPWWVPTVANSLK